MLSLLIIRKLKLPTLFLFLFISTIVQAQPGCPNVNAGNDQTVTCSNTCATLTATAFATGATTSYVVSSIPYSPPYPYNTGTAIMVNQDDVWGSAITLPFNFCLYGVSYNKIVPGSNGCISFNTSNAGGFCAWQYSVSCPNANIISGSTGPYVLGPYQDIDPAVTGTMYYAILGAYPCRTFVISWNHVADYSCTSQISTNQIVLYEGTNVVEVYMQNKPLCASWNGGNAVIGIQNAAGNTGVTPPGRNTGQWTANNEAWRFTPNGAPNYAITWWQGATQIASGTTVTVCPTTTTTYTAQAVYTECYGLITTSDNVIVNVNNSMPASVTPATSSICNGGTASLTASSGTSYNWSNGLTSQTISVSPATTTTYTVTVHNNACASTATATVTVTPLPPPSLNGPPTICPGSCTTLTASGGTTYQWVGGPATSTYNVCPMTTTTYTVTAYNSGCSSSSSVTVTVSPVIPVDAGPPQNICSGGSASLTATGGITYQWVGGPASAFYTVSPSVTTTYIVTAYSNGCSASDNVTVTVNSAPPLDAGSSVSICPGDVANLLATGATTYQWNGGPATAAWSVSPATTTTYVVTGYSNGCSATDNVTVTVKPLPNASAGPPQALCLGAAVTLIATGGGTYQWVGGPSTATYTVNPLTTTTYTVNVTNLGCIASSQVTVTVNSSPVIDAGPPQTICNGSNATLTATGGTTYQWVGGPSTATYICAPTTTTTYIVTASLTGGCSASDNVTVTVLPVPVIDAGNPVTICQGISTTLSATGGTSFQWTGGPATSTYVVTPNATTTYVVAGFSNGCSAADSVVVTVNPRPAADAGPDLPICLGTPAVLTATGGGSYHWSGGSNSATYFVSPSPSVTTTYYVTVTNNGCTASDSVTVIVNTNPIVDAGPHQKICHGTSTTLSASGGTTYHWQGGPVSQTYVVTPLVTTLYTVTVYLSGGCSATDTVSVSVTALPPVDAGPPQAICLGTPGTLTATGGSTYQWLNGPATSTYIINPVAATTYTVTAYLNGCSASDIVNVTVNSSPVANAGPSQIICQGTSANLTASGGGTYSWVGGPNTANYTVSPATTTTYTVTVTSTGCSASDSLIVTVKPKPLTDAGPPLSICNGNSTVLAATGGTTYQWQGGPATATDTVHPATTTTYTVTAYLNGCSASDNVVITVNPLPTVDAGATQSICPATSATLNATGTNGSSFSWTGGPSTASYTVSPPDTTTYVVTALLNGCTASDSVIVNVKPLPPLDPGSDQSICLGHTAMLQAFGGTSYQWQGGPATDIYNVTPSTQTTYTVTAYLNGCSASDTVTVTVKPIPVADAGPPQTICTGNSATLTEIGGDGTFWVWFGGYMGQSYTVNPTSTTTYTVTAYLNGCVASDTVTVSVVSFVSIDAGAHQTICSGSSATLLATGGTSYQWSGGGPATAQYIVSPLVTTTYTVTAYLSGCSATDTVTVSVKNLPPADAGPHKIICTGTSTTLNASGGTSYQWQGGPSTANYAVSPLVNTVYTVSVTSNGCIATDTVSVSVKPLPAVDAGPYQLICTGNSTTLTASGGTTYIWAPGGPSSASWPVSPIVTTHYTVTATLNGCTASDTVSVAVISNPVASAGNPQTICNGTSLTLSASGGNTYQWLGGPATQTYVVSPSVTTTYTVTAYLTGCSASASVTITVNSIPNVDAGAAQTICSGTSATLIATGGTTYQWQGGPAAATWVVSPSVTTQYTVVGTTNGCTASDTVTITIKPLPATDAGTDQTICHGSSATLIASGGTTYQWQGGPASATWIVSPTATTHYTVAAYLNGCSASDSVTVSVYALPATDAGPAQTICNGTTVTLTASGGTTYQWQGGPAAANYVVTPSATTQYTVTAYLNGCSASDTVTITVKPTPTADAGPAQTVCSGTNITLTATGGTTYTWAPGGPSTASWPVSPTVTTHYTVTATLNGCTATDTVTITVKPLPATDAGPAQTICQGFGTTLTATGGTTYQWLNGPATDVYPVSPVVSTLYAVTATLNGCTASDTVTVSVMSSPIANAGPTVTICSGSSATLTATGGSFYLWQGGPATAQYIVSPTTTTVYTVTASLTGCSSTDSVSVIVLPLPIAEAGAHQTICSGSSATLVATGGTTYQWQGGPASDTYIVSPLVTTTYVVTAITNGCSATDTVTVSVTNLPPVDAGMTQTICTGTSATLNATGGTTYQWQGGPATATYIVSPTTTTLYTVTGTTSGCSASDTVTVIVSPRPTVVAGTPQTICSGHSVTFTATGATTYLWSNSSPTATIIVSPTQTTIYSVTGTLNGCTDSASVTVTVNPLPVASAGADTAICYGAVAQLHAGGGTGYSWSSPVSNPNIYNPTANPVNTTTYTVTVTDINGCSQTDAMVLTVHPQIQPTINAGQAICAGASANLQAGGGANYSWSPAGTLVNAGTANPTATPAATATYFVTISDAFGCTAHDSTVVTVNPVPTSTFTVTSPVCAGQTSTITYTGTASTGANYTWNFVGGTVVNGTGQGPYQIRWNSPSTYNITLTVTENNCTSSLTTMPVFVDQATVTLAVVDSISCFGVCDGQISATAGGVVPFTYSWSNAQTTQALTNLCANTYTVTVTDADGCTASQTITLTQPQPLQMVFTSQNVSCFGASDGSGSATVTGGTHSYIYSWLPNPSVTNTATGLQAGNFTFLVTDAHGCTLDSAFTITEPLQLTFTSVIDSVNCFGGADGSITLLPNGGVRPYFYTWSPSVSTDSLASNLSMGNYSVTVTDVNGCSTSSSLTVDEPTQIILSNSGSTHTCNGQSTTISASATGGTGSYTFTWDNGLGVGNNFVVAPLVTTTYNVTVTDIYGCSAAPQSLTITVATPITVTVTATPASFCVGGSAGLLASPSGGNGFYTYTWGQGIGVSTQSVNVSPAVTTWYPVTVTDNCNSVPGIDSVLVTVYPIPTVQFAPDTTRGCQPFSVRFFDNSTPAITAWNWNFGDPSSGSDNTSSLQNPNHVYANSGTYSVTLTVTSANGCTATYTSFNMITVYPLPVADFTYTPSQTTILDPQIQFLNSSSNAASWNWNFNNPLSGNDNYSNLQSPIHIFTNPGTYNVTLVVTSPHGCIDSATNHVTLKSDFTFYAPNAFTPGNDGLDDVFLPLGKEWDVDHYQFYVFDRWGGVIFKTTDVNKGWDGTVNGGTTVVQQGVYVWLVLLQDLGGLKHIMTGRVTLISK